MAGKKRTQEVQRKSRRTRAKVSETVARKQKIVDSNEESDQIEDSHSTTTARPKRQKITQLGGFINSFTRSPSPASSRPVKSINNHDQWIDKYEPTSVQTVAIHSRKLRDVKEQLISMLRQNSDKKLLVLSGPSGVSKSTIVKRLADELLPHNANSEPIIEWINPIETYPSQFDDFLGAAKYRTGRNLSIILVEDLPNVFHDESRERFQRSLMEWIHTDTNLPPLILCVTECDFPQDENSKRGYSIETSFTVETVLGRKILNSPYVERIKFNPVNTLLIKKCLKHITANEPDVFGNISKEFINEKITDLMTTGDIRAAISSFQFWAQWKANNESEVLSIGKETSLSLFHAAGKCIFGSKSDSDETTISKVIQDYGNRADILKLSLLENYTKFNKSAVDIETIAAISDDYSFADLLQQNSVSLECAIRSTRDGFNKTKLDSKSEIGLTFPREWKINRAINTAKEHINYYIEIEMNRRGIMRNFSNSNLYHGFYEPLINEQRAFRNKAKLHYLQSLNRAILPELYEPITPYLQSRLGGPFKEIHGDEAKLPDMDEANGISHSNDEYFKHGIKSHDGEEDDRSDSEFDDDPIVESEDEIYDDTFGHDDTFEKELIQLSQRKTLNAKNAEFLNDFDDDDDEISE